MKNQLHALQKFAIFFFVIEGFVLFGGIISGSPLTLGGPWYGQLAYLFTIHIFLWIGLILWLVGRRKRG